MSGGPLVVAGAGDLGGRIVALRLERGEEVIALRRGEGEPVPGLRRQRADLASGKGLGALPREAGAIVFCAAPDQRDEAAYRALYLDGLRRLLDACTARRILFVSSTAVYGQDDGAWVDEDSPAEPAGFNGRILLQAEQVLAPQPEGIALRLSGLYGPGREYLLRKARSGEAGERRWSNRIHVEDAAAAVSGLLDLGDPQRLYLASDDQPALESDVLAWLRAQEGLDPVKPDAGAECGRRIGNARLRASGWRPVHPDYIAGYRGLVQAPGV